MIDNIFVANPAYKSREKASAPWRYSMPDSETYLR
jgi:hypothetical protein